MNFWKSTLPASVALALLIGAGWSHTVSAQQPCGGPYGQGPGYVPTYTRWQPGWNMGNYDRNHVMLGIVTNFSPYRLTLRRRNGITQTIDLKNGTEIFPQGSTPGQGQRVAVLGYWSNGTFIANRLVLQS
jgi:hypothetical protein